MALARLLRSEVERFGELLLATLRPLVAVLPEDPLAELVFNAIRSRSLELLSLVVELSEAAPPPIGTIAPLVAAIAARVVP